MTCVDFLKKYQNRIVKGSVIGTTAVFGVTVGILTATGVLPIASIALIIPACVTAVVGQMIKDPPDTVHDIVTLLESRVPTSGLTAPTADSTHITNIQNRLHSVASSLGSIYGARVDSNSVSGSSLQSEHITVQP